MPMKCSLADRKDEARSVVAAEKQAHANITRAPGSLPCA
jgi:hypothetical protein